MSRPHFLEAPSPCCPSSDVLLRFRPGGPLAEDSVAATSRLLGDLRGSAAPGDRAGCGSGVGVCQLLLTRPVGLPQPRISDAASLDRDLIPLLPRDLDELEDEDEEEVEEEEEDEESRFFLWDPERFCERPSRFSPLASLLRSGEGSTLWPSRVPLAPGRWVTATIPPPSGPSSSADGDNGLALDRNPTGPGALS